MKRKSQDASEDRCIINNYPLSKNKPTYHARNVNRRHGFVGIRVVIDFIMQSLLEERGKNLTCFLSKRENLRSAIFFIYVYIYIYIYIFFFFFFFFCQKPHAKLIGSPFCRYTLL